MTFRKGFPSITTPHGADRSIQNAIDNIRARLDQIETELLASTGALQQSVSTLGTTVAATSTATTTTTTAATYKAAVPITAGQALYESSSGFVSVADPTILAQSFAVFGVAQSSTGPGGTVTVAVSGSVANLPTASFAASYPVFCGPAGVLSQTPTYGYPALQVGVALSVTTMLVQPDNQLIAILVNGTTVGYRRAVNFISSGTVAFFAADNPGANRVDVTIGSGGVIVGLPPAKSFVTGPQSDTGGASFSAGQVAGH